VKTIPILEWSLKKTTELETTTIILERDVRLGLAALKREKFDMMSLDVMINMDGFTLAEEIRCRSDISLFFS